jgi:hypothetical protein
VLDLLYGLYDTVLQSIFVYIWYMVDCSDLPAGTAGTGRVHPRQAVGTVGMGRRFFFQNRTLPVSYLCPSRVHGYGYGGTQAHGSVSRERDGSAGQTL